MSIKSFGERIADVLIEDGLLLPAQLEEAMDLQKKQGGRLLKLLDDKQYVTEQDMVISMGRCLDTPPINLSKIRVPEDIQDLVPKDMAAPVQARAGLQAREQALRGDGRSVERARARRSAPAHEARDRADDHDRARASPRRSAAWAAPARRWTRC